MTSSLRTVLSVVALSALVNLASAAALTADESAAIRRLLAATPHPEAAVDWENYVFAASRGPRDSYAYTKDMLEFTTGVSFIGNLPHKASKDLKSTAVAMGLCGIESATVGMTNALDKLAEAGVKKARVFAFWNWWEKERGVYDFALLDEIVRLCRERAIEPWLSLGGTPKCYLAEPIPKGTDFARQAPCYHPGAEEAYLKAVDTLVRRYRGKVCHYELCNECDAHFRNGKDDAWALYGADKAARDMVAHYAKVAAAIRAVDSTSMISISFCKMSSALVPRLGAYGFGDVIDWYAIHSYERCPEFMMEEAVRMARSALKKKDGTPVRIIMGESGRAADRSGRFSTHTEYGQAKFTARHLFFDVFLGCEVVSFFEGCARNYSYFNPRTMKPRLGYYVLQGLGWLFEDLKPAPHYAVRFNTLGPQEFTPLLPYVRSIRTAFDRKGVPVIALWLPEHLDINQQRRDGRLEIVTDGLREHLLPNPVIIDPIRRKVWDASGLVYRNPMGDDEFRAFPLMDYPLVVTDLSVFRDFIGK